MKPRTQRLHSAELRRLDRIAQSLDRIAVALEKLPDIIVTGDNDTIIEHSQNVLLDSSGNEISMQAQKGGNNNRMASNDNNTNTIHGNGSIQYENSESFNTNSNEAIKNLTTALKQ